MALRLQRGLGMSGDRDKWLGMKYGIMKQEADARTVGAQRQFVNQGIEGGAGDIALDPLTEQLKEAQLANAQAQLGLTKAQTLGVKTATSNADTEGVAALKALNGSGENGMLQGPLAEAFADFLESRGGGNAKGLTRVPGKGDGTKDKVVTAVAPGEAILNKKAADKLGRGLIAALNAQGARKMGLV
jgi:hypothetical protein